MADSPAGRGRVAVGRTVRRGGQEGGEQPGGHREFTSFEAEGKDLPERKGSTVTIESGKFTVRGGGAVIQAGTQKLDPKKHPKTIDATVEEGPDKGVTMLGIYKVEGDTMKMCFDHKGKKRPTEFKTAAASGHFLVVTKRIKR